MLCLISSVSWCLLCRPPPCTHTRPRCRYSGQGDGFMNTEYQATLVEKTFPHKPQCPNHANAIYDCGFYNITEQQCLDRKCCWDPTSPKVSLPHLQSCSACCFTDVGAGRNSPRPSLRGYPRSVLARPARSWAWDLVRRGICDGRGAS